MNLTQCNNPDRFNIEKETPIVYIRVDTMEGFGRMGAPYVLVSINPDWHDELGHHAQLDRTVRAAAVDVGAEFISLTSLDKRADANWQVPTFTHKTYGFPTIHPGLPIQTFEIELADALEITLSQHPETPIRVMMYSAGIAHIPAILSVADRLHAPRVAFFINLLRSPSDLLLAATAAAPTYPDLLLRLVLEAGPSLRVHVFADNEAFAQLVEKLTGHSLSVWPMVGTTNLHGIKRPTLDASDSGPSTIRVCFAGTQIIKGSTEFVELAELARKDGSLTGVLLMARDLGYSPETVVRLRTAGVEVVEGVLSPGEYATWIASADAVTIPYHANPFQILTSGAFADAVRLRIPVVAALSTWAGRIVESNDLGTTFDVGDTAGYLDAIRRLADSYSHYCARMDRFAPEWLRRNNPEALLATFDRSTDPPSTDYDRASLCAQLPVALQSVVDQVMDEAAERESSIVRRLDRRIVTRDHEIAQLQTTIAKRNTQIDTRNREIAQLQTTIAKRDTQIDTRNREIAQLQTTIAKRNTQIDTRNREIAQLQTTINELRSQIRELAALMKTREAAALSKRREFARTPLERMARTLGSLPSGWTQTHRTRR